MFMRKSPRVQPTGFFRVIGAKLVTELQGNKALTELLKYNSCI